MGYHNTLNTDVRTKLSSTKPDIEEICKNEKSYYTLLSNFGLEIIVFFHKNCIYIN